LVIFLFLSVIIALGNIFFLRLQVYVYSSPAWPIAHASPRPFFCAQQRIWRAIGLSPCFDLSTCMGASAHASVCMCVRTGVCGLRARTPRVRSGLRRAGHASTSF
jgi:hypothetical protein